MTKGARWCALFVGVLALAGCPPPTTNGPGAIDLVYVSTRDGASVLVAFDLDEGGGRALEGTGPAAQSPALLDADTVVGSSDGAMYRLSLVDDTVTSIDLGGLIGVGPIVSTGDGAATLLFAGSEAVGDDVTANQDVYRVAPEGGAPIRLTDDAAADSPAGVRDDGAVVFVSNRSGRFDLWHMDTAGENEAPLVVDSGVLGRPAVSRDGRTLCWERGGSLVVADSAGGVPAPLGGADGVVGSDPAFDAAGRVFFRRFLPDFTAEIFVFDPADGSTTQVTRDGAVASAPVLMP